MYLNYLLLHPFSPPSSCYNEGSTPLPTKANRLTCAPDTLPGASTARDFSGYHLFLLNHPQHLTNMLAWFPHYDGPLWPLMPFQLCLLTWRLPVLPGFPLPVTWPGNFLRAGSKLGQLWGALHLFPFSQESLSCAAWSSVFKIHCFKYFPPIFGLFHGGR